MNDHDRNERGENGADGERVVVRDRRRIDPVTGEVRIPPGDISRGGPAGGAVPATSEEAEPSGLEHPDLLAVDQLEEVVQLEAQVAERTADLQRVSAEYANYRRRVDRDRESVLVGARVQFVSELLTVLDDLDRAEMHGDLAGPFKAVGDKITAVVQKLGLEPFGLAGETFDPSVHEAVQHDITGADGPSVAVLSAVLRRGYRIADRVLRPAMVTVTDRADDLGHGDATVGDPDPDRAEGS